MSTEIRLSFKIQFPHSVVVWVLQLGGWLPIQFSPVRLMLVDKNVIRAIDKISVNPDRPDMEAERFWLDHLNSEQLVLNAFLCAHEGDSRGVPTFDAFCASLVECQGILARALPKARLIEHSAVHFNQLYENVTALADRHAREAAFLLEVVPLLHRRVSSKNARRVEEQLLVLARKHGLAVHSFVVITALSCLYEPQDGSEPMIGRGVLKPTSNYTEADAHNALSDLRALEGLALSVGMDGPPVGYCTRDRAMAALWTYLRLAAPQWSGNNSFTASLSPAVELFPRLDAKSVRELFLRIQ